MAGETETVSLNLDGTFDAAADKDAAAAEKLGTSLGKLEAQMHKLAQADAKRAVIKSKDFQASNPLTSLLENSTGFAKVKGWVGKLFGQGASNELNNGAKNLADAGDKLGVTPEKLSSAAGAVAAGGAVVLTAATALAAAAGALLAAGAKFGIEQTDAAKTQAAIFKQMGKGGGYGTAVKIATDLGLPEDGVIAKTKALLNAKLAQSSIKDIIKVGIGLDEAQGEGAGDKFAKTLEAIKNTGKFDAKSVKQFAKEGISAEEVYAKLAKSMGLSVDAVKAKVKAGTLDVDKGIQGVLDVAKGKFGKIADIMADSIPALVMKVKLAFASLFKGFDLAPVKAFLKDVAKVLEGPSGKALGKGFAETFKAIAALLGGLGGKVGGVKGIVDTVAQGVARFAGFVKAITPDVLAFVTQFKKGFGEASPALSEVGKIIKTVLGLSTGGNAGVRAFARSLGMIVGGVVLIAGVMLAVASPIIKVGIVFVGVVTIVVGGIAFLVTKVVYGIAFVVNAIIGLPGKAIAAFSKFNAGARNAGTNFAGGLAGGILGGLGKAVAAAAKMASAALAKVKSILGVASDAKALIAVGGFMASGLARGQNDNADKPAKAAAKMAGGAAKAAAGAAGGAGGGKGGAGGAGGGAVTIVVQIGGNIANAQAVGQQAGAAAAEEWKKQMRAFQREQQEGRAA